MYSILASLIFLVVIAYWGLSFRKKALKKKKIEDSKLTSWEKMDDDPANITHEHIKSIPEDNEEKYYNNLLGLHKAGFITKKQMYEMLEKHEERMKYQGRY